jgi:hypothetical protein
MARVCKSLPELQGQMVSWQLDHVGDVYQTSESEIDLTGTEVYSKLNRRRMSSVRMASSQHWAAF